MSGEIIYVVLGHSSGHGPDWFCSAWSTYDGASIEARRLEAESDSCGYEVVEVTVDSAG